jgi:putative ABC transport system permease protein
MLQDIRYGIRMLRKNAGFTAVALVALALGIGANTAIFSVVNAVLLRPLPFADQERLMLIWASKPQRDFAQLPLSLPNFNDVKGQSQAFDGIAAWALGRFNLSGDGEPEQVQYAVVSADFFPVLGARPALGRDFLPSENQPSDSRAVIISHGLWQRRFAGEQSVIGRSVTLDGQSYEVAGVLPQDFRFVSFPKETDVWLPFGLDPFQDRKYARGANSLGVIARLRGDATVESAQAEMSTIAGRLEEQFPRFNRGLKLNIVPLREQVIKRFKTGLLVLLGAVGLVLLIACANVANLLLARAKSRQKEIAIRTALGASRFRIIRQMLTESLLLALSGGALGLLIAVWGVELLASVPYNTPDLFTPYNIANQQIGLDGRVLVFTLALSALTGVVFGLAPAIQVSNSNLNESLKDAGTKSGAGRRNRARGLLVVSEVALSVMLLVGAGLLIKSFARLNEVDPGFRAENVLTANVKLPQSKYRENRQVATFYKQLLDRASLLPAVESAGAVEYLPMSGIDSSTGFFIDGRPEPAPTERPQTHYRAVSSDYFRSMGMVIREGRAFRESDDTEAPRVALVNETMARRYWPDENPIGKRVALDLEAMRFYPDRAPDMDIPSAMREIVGVVADVKHSRLEGEAVPEMYIPYLQRPTRDMTVVLRTNADPAGLIPALRDVAAAIDKDQAIADINTMSNLLTASIAQPRFNMLLLAIFAALALLLAAVGVYGVVSYSVTERTREIGIRMALGAGARDVLGLVMKEGLMLSMIGVAAGLAAALAMTRVLSSLLFDVSATDPIVFAGISLILMGVALGASFVPARRATKVDPMVALRHE